MIKPTRVRIASLLIIVLLGHRLAAAQQYSIESVAKGLSMPWSLAFLPDDRILVTELGGQLRLLDNGALSEQPVEGVPQVYRAGQGGLMDVMVDRNFAANQRIYLSYAHGTRRANATRLVSARLVDGALLDQQVLFTASPLKSTPHHYGGRMAQMPDGSILLTVGDGFNYREQAQKLDNHFGKIVRIQADGTIPQDNPYIGEEGALPEIWSYGHRNMQAIVVTGDGAVYSHEHGPQGGDEINLIQRGKNYGWPVITHGIDYNGARITPFTEYAGMQQPLVDWTPSIAPAGMTYYNGTLFPQWRGDLLAATLKEKSVRRIRIGGGTLELDERILPQLDQRLRDIRTAPDGSLYILTDGEEGELLRVTRQ